MIFIIESLMETGGEELALRDATISN